MTRAILLTSLLYGACFSGELGGVGPQVDAKVDIDAPDAAPPPDMGPALGCVERGTPGIAYNHDQAGTYAGDVKGCVSGDCHLNGQTGLPAAPAFQFAGTIYKKGTMDPDPGAIIIIVPDNPAAPSLQAIADTAGNFYIPYVQGTSGNNLPATAGATVCPDLTKGHLSGKLATTAPGGTPVLGENQAGKAGNCNGCHAVGGTQTPIYVNPVISL